MRLLFTTAFMLALAAPASAHLLHRGVPLSELSASSPLAVIGRVVSDDGETVELAVERAVLGTAPSGPLRFQGTGHHPPRYTPGSQVLVFLSSSEAPFRSGQTQLDRLEWPEASAERDALLKAVQSFAGLRGVADKRKRLAALKAICLDHLSSKSERLRHEAVLDLVAIAPRTPFSASEIAKLKQLASDSETPETLAPGLVLLLTAIRQPEADRALFSVLESEGQPRARARAAHVIAKRHGAKASEVLRRAIGDPAVAVSATARHMLAEIESKASSQRIALDFSASNPGEGNHHEIQDADPN